MVEKSIWGVIRIRCLHFDLNVNYVSAYIRCLHMWYRGLQARQGPTHWVHSDRAQVFFFFFTDWARVGLSSFSLSRMIGWALFVTYTIIQSIMWSEMCSLHLTHPSVHIWSSGQPTVQRPGSSRGLPVGAGIRTHNLGLPRVSSPTLYPLGQRLSPFIVPIYAQSTHGHCMKYWLYYKYYTSPTHIRTH